MNEILMECTYFGAALTLACYLAGVWLQKRFPRPIVNPLLIGSALVMAFLVFFHIDYDTYDEGAKYITYFMTPATVCLAIPMYKQMQILKKNADFKEECSSGVSGHTVRVHSPCLYHSGVCSSF